MFVVVELVVDGGREEDVVVGWDVVVLDACEVDELSVSDDVVVVSPVWIPSPSSSFMTRIPTMINAVTTAPAAAATAQIGRSRLQSPAPRCSEGSVGDTYDMPSQARRVPGDRLEPKVTASLFNHGSARPHQVGSGSDPGSNRSGRQRPSRLRAGLVLATRARVDNDCWVPYVEVRPACDPDAHLIRTPEWPGPTLTSPRTMAGPLVDLMSSGLR